MRSVKYFRIFGVGSCISAVIFLRTVAFAEDKLSFNHDVRPILSAYCFECHGPDAKARKAKLRLDQAASATAERNGVVAAAPGKPEDSELLRRILSDDPDEVMPPPELKRALTAEQKNTLRRWIAEGAEFEEHWAYQKPRRPAPPKTKNPSWGYNEIDAFVLARLEEAGLAPSPEADKYALVRRLHLDLTGLPPSPEEADAFVNDASPDAYENLVDRLLASHAYGEHQARQWLDLARYADSAGYADDQPRTIWGYRDWVIQAFNRNLPFDRFTIEQIAGDLLPEPTPDQLVATAFNRNTQTNNEGGTNDEEFRNVAVVDRVNTTMAVWMGVTMGCAQCHDHKYDPISQEEYFRVFAIFNNTADADRRDESPYHQVYSAEQKAEKQRKAKQVSELEKKLAALKAQSPEMLDAWAASFAEPLRETDVTSEAAPQGGGASIVLPDGKFAGIRLPGSPANVEFLLAANAERPGKKGRFVRVTHLAKSAFLHLAEVQVFSGGENLAPAGKAKQVSTDFGGPAKYGNDGNTDGNYASKSVFHTAQGDNPWWEVDLGKESFVDKIVVWNRMDAGTADRLKKFKVELFDEKRVLRWSQEVAKTPKPSHALILDGSEALPAVPFPHPGATDVFRFARPLAPKAGMVLQARAKGFSPKDSSSAFLLAAPLPELDQPLPKDVFAILSLPARERSPAQRDRLRAHYVAGSPAVKKAEKELETLSASVRQMKPFTTVPIMQELPEGKRRKTHVQTRGNFLAKEKEVTEGVPAVFHPLPEDEETPNRLTLARWLVSPENPLTARVVANRHWEAFFGQGIVRTSEEFGSQGELPTHPALLDWLATELVRNNWDLKKFVKTIVLSATYRQSVKVDDARASADPFNELLSRGPRRRLTAEMVRDHALAASGLLSRKTYGPPVKPPQPSMGLSAAFGPGLDWKTSPGEDKFRRGLYVHWRRSNPYPSMATFDAPNRFVCNVRRTPTNTPLQALVTLNDPVYVEAAQALARRMTKKAGTPAEIVERGFRLCLTRPPSAAESERILGLYAQARKAYAEDTASAKILAADPIGPLPEKADPVELAAWTIVGNVLLNLDEVFLKR